MKKKLLVLTTVLVLVVSAFALTGCGQPADSLSPTPTPEATVQPTPEPTPDPTPRLAKNWA